MPTNSLEGQFPETEELGKLRDVGQRYRLPGARGARSED